MTTDHTKDLNEKWGFILLFNSVRSTKLLPDLIVQAMKVVFIMSFQQLVLLRPVKFNIKNVFYLQFFIMNCSINIANFLIFSNYGATMLLSIRLPFRVKFYLLLTPLKII